MDLLILIILTIIYCFVICFIVQSSANKCEGTISRIKIFIPNCKENIIMFLGSLSIVGVIRKMK